MAIVKVRGFFLVFNKRKIKNMKNDIKSWIFYILIALFLGNSCSNDSENQESDHWKNTTWHYLEGEPLKIRMPNQMKKSSRYRIEEDLPWLSNDPFRLLVLQSTLHQLEYQDAEVDVFIDTTTRYRVVIICNTQKVDFSAKDINRLKQQLQAEFLNNKAINPDLAYEKIDAKMGKSPDLVLASLKTSVAQVSTNERVNSVFYFLTGTAFTLAVFEITDTEETVEKYLWTARPG